MIDYGIQMYSLRDAAELDLCDALSRVAKMGYKYIEFAGFFDKRAEDVKSWLEEYGLIASGTHTGIPLLEDDKIDETIEYHKAIGCKRLIVPGADWSTPEAMEHNIAVLRAALPKLRDAGISLGYHNHSGEFFKTAYGKYIMQEIIERTDVLLEVDTFWLYNARVDVIPFLDKHKERIEVIHLKDGIPTDAPIIDITSCHKGVVGKSVGEGKAPVLAVRDWAISNNVLMVIESEGLMPNGTDEVRRCIDYLRRLEEI